MNPVIGFNKCPECGGQTEVMQAKRRGSHLYERCGACDDLNQKTGKPMQNRLYWQSQWRPGIDLIKPSNVMDRPQDLQPVKPRVDAVNSDFNPCPVEITNAEKIPGKKRKGGLMKAAGVSVVLIAMCVGAMKT